MISIIDDPVMIAIIVAQLVYIFSLRKRMAGLSDPRIYLSKAERRAWARTQLAQQEEDRNADQFQRNNDIVFGPRPTHKENE